MRVLLLILLSISMIECLGQDTVRIVKYGSSDKEQGVQILENLDSTYHVLMNSGDASFKSNSSIQIIKIDDNDNVLMAKSISSSASEYANDFIVTDDSIIVVCGLSNAIDTRYSGFVYFLGPNNTLVERYEAIGNNWSEYSNVILSGDDIIIVLEAITSSTLEPVILSYSKTGLERKRITLSNLHGYKFLEFKKSIWGGGYIGCGSFPSDSSNGFVIRLDSDFNVEWEYDFSLSGFDQFIDIDEFSDSTIVAIGQSDGFFEDDLDIVVAKLSADGNPIDTIVQGYDVSANNNDEYPSGLFVFNDTVYFTGYTYTYGKGGSEPFMTVLTKDLGLIPYSSTFGSGEDEFSFDCVRNSRMLKGVGYSRNATNGLDDLMIWTREIFNPTFVVVEEELRTYDVNDTIVGFSEENIIEKSETASWRPVDQGIELILPRYGFKHVSIYDITGVRIGAIYLPSTTTKTIFNTGAAGVYIVRIEYSDYAETLKVFAQ